METPSKQLTRVRTFKDDFLRAQEAAGISPSLPTQPTTKTSETVTPLQTEASSDKQITPTTQPTTPVSTRQQPVATIEVPSFDEIVESDTDTVSPVTTSSPEITVIESEPAVEAVPDTSVPKVEESKEGSVLPIDQDTPPETTVPTKPAEAPAPNVVASATDDFDPYTINEVEEGTIITDQKNDDFRIIPALVDMVSDSVMGVVDRWFGQPEVERTITRAETRTDILKKAAARSALAPQDDFGTVTEHKEKTGAGSGLATPVVQIKDKTVAAPSWSHVVEQEDSGNAASVDGSPEPEPTSGYTNWSEAPPAETKQEAAVRVDALTESVPAQTTAMESETDTPAEPVEEFVTPPPPQTETIAEPEPVMTPEQPQPTPALQPSADPAPQAVRRYAPASEPAPRNMLVAFGVVIFIATVLGVSVSVWLFGGSDSTVATNVTPTVTSLVRTEQSVAVPLGNSANELLRNLLAATTQPNLTLTHLNPTVISGGVSRPASSEEILTVLDLRTPGSFTRTVETLSFGLYQDREPYVVMKVTNFDNAFSGTLTWEPFMSSDLSPFFGAPVTGTFNPQSRSATQVEDPYFVDTVVANYDTRILRNERQEERLLYSFVNRNTLVITTSREALEQVAGSLR